MSQLQAILNYQTVDSKLYKLERELAESDERKKYVKMQKFIKTAPEKLDSLELKATALKAEADSLAAKYAQVESTLGEFENLEEMVRGGADIGFYKKEAQKIAEQLKKLKADINALAANVKATDEEYKELKKQVMAAEEPYKKAAKLYKDLKASKEEERVAIETELKALEKEIPAEMLEKYQVKRKEKIFPVVGELKNGRCWFCGMEPPIAAQSKLANGIECDNCHRMIFKQS